MTGAGPPETVFITGDTVVLKGLMSLCASPPLRKSHGVFLWGQHPPTGAPSALRCHHAEPYQVQPSEGHDSDELVGHCEEHAGGQEQPGRDPEYPDVS